MSSGRSALLGAVLAVALVLGLPAGAAPMPITPATIFVQYGPAQVVAALFSAGFATPGPIVTGTALDVGGTWTVAGGTWQTSGGAATMSSGNARSHVWVGAGRADLELRARVALPNNGAIRRSGIMFRGTSSTSYLQLVYFHTNPSGELRLQKVTPTAVTDLRVVALPGSSRPDEVAFRVRLDGSQIRVWLDPSTTALFTHTLTGADATTYGSGTRAGITTAGDQSIGIDHIEGWP